MKKDKSRNHPANPVGKPDPHLHTLTSAPVETELKPDSDGTPDPFSHSPILETADLHRYAAEWFRDFCVMIILYHVFFELSS